MNKELFKNNLKNKNYSKCIDDLREEIILNLTEKIKEKDKYFSYSTTKDLYIKSKKVLDLNDSKIAYTLYNLDIGEETEKYILDQLMELYMEILKE